MSLISSALILAKRARYELGQNVALDEAEAKQEYKKFLRGVEKTILRQVREVIEHPTIIEEAFNLTAKSEANPLIVTLLGKVFRAFNIVFEEENGSTVLDFLIWSGKEGGQAALEKMGIDASFELTNEGVTAFLADHTNLLIASVDNTTKATLSKLITQAREDLLTSYETAKLIEAEFKSISPVRAEMIAQTELANAVNAVEYETFKRNGVRQLRWVTVMDERVCQICEPLHNTIVNTDSLFANVYLRPPAHIRCRCFLEEVIDGLFPRNNTLIWSGS